MKGRIRFWGMVIILGLLALVLSSGALCWAQKAKPPKPPQPPPPPADPAIVYIDNIYKGAAVQKTIGQLMVMNADGTNQRVALTEKGVAYYDPTWSPDGTQLVFTREDLVARRSSICIINLDGTGFRKIIDESSENESIEGPATWSPVPLLDGQYKIAFSRSLLRPDGSYEIDHDAYFINPDGSGLFQLTNTLGVGEGLFSWSPTADRVTFPWGDGGFIVCWINYDPDTGVFSLATERTCFEFGWGIWANTQDTLAVSKLDANGVNDIWIYCLDSSSYPLTSTPNSYEHDQAWTPDDSKILFVQGLTGQLCVINSDGTGLTPICPGVDFSWRSPRWRRNP